MGLLCGLLTYCSLTKTEMDDRKNKKTDTNRQNWTGKKSIITIDKQTHMRTTIMTKKYRIAFDGQTLIQTERQTFSGKERPRQR